MRNVGVENAKAYVPSLIARDTGKGRTRLSAQWVNLINDSNDEGMSYTLFTFTRNPADTA